MNVFCVKMSKVKLDAVIGTVVGKIERGCSHKAINMFILSAQYFIT
jgi:hypothetical protein